MRVESRLWLRVALVSSVLAGGCSSSTPGNDAATGNDSPGAGDAAGDSGPGNDTATRCTGTAPLCFGNNLSQCCGQDPAGDATCENGVWMCGGAAAPGCNGNSCLNPPDAGTDMPQTDGGCSGTAPNCFGNDTSQCCGQDPSGQATCENGAWMCGAAAAPGCNGNSCLNPPDGGSDMSQADGGCTGTAPNCFGNDTSMCCGQDPSGQATCENGAWMCGAAAAPGCNGTSCLNPPDGGVG
jgi:hypothetical protein